MIDFNKLIPELKDWNNGKGIDIYSWIGCVGDFQKAIGYSVIFWPEFIEIDGGVDINNAEKLYKTGADILVAGNAVFSAQNPIQTINDIRSKKG